MRTLTLALALALAGCSSWHAVVPGDTDLISRARQVRVTSSETGRLYAGTGLAIDLRREGMEDPGYDIAIVTDPYVDESSNPELGFVTLRGDVDL